jgi:hypothetical protein
MPVPIRGDRRWPSNPRMQRTPSAPLMRKPLGHGRTRGPLRGRDWMLGIIWP